VQSDQSALPAGTTGRRPKLVDPLYETHDAAGRIIDSYDAQTGGLTARSDTASTGRYLFVASGYRESDGRPAPYASTGLRRDAAWPTTKRDFAPNGALPTDDSPTLFGILASGARDGSQIAYRGTSFAAAQATRLLAARLAKVG